MIYTIVPIEQVLSESEKELKCLIKARYMDEDVMLSQTRNGDFYMDRLLSTNPLSYLKNEFYPGIKADAGKIKRD